MAAQLGLPDYEVLIEPMWEFCREKVVGLKPGAGTSSSGPTTALSFEGFRGLLEALYNPQLPDLHIQRLQQQQANAPSVPTLSIQQQQASKDGSVGAAGKQAHGAVVRGDHEGVRVVVAAEPGNAELGAGAGR